MLPLDVSKSDPSFVGAAFALILACGWIPSLFVPMIFQPALDRGISKQIVMAIFAIPTLVSVFIKMFIRETDPKAKQMQAEGVTHLSS
jgi:hypothetical protein